jgi:hypothetical protein
VIVDDDGDEEDAEDEDEDEDEDGAGISVHSMRMGDELGVGVVEGEVDEEGGCESLWWGKCGANGAES